MTKREITTSIINALGKQHDHELYERIKDRVVMLRAKLLRQSMAQHGVDDLLLQTYKVNMIQKTDLLGCVYLESDCKVFIPIRTHNNTVPFLSVTTLLSSPLTYLRPYEEATIPRIPINALNQYYGVKNLKLTSYNSTAKVLVIQDVLEDFKQLDVDCSGACEDDDTLLPMPADFAGDIIRILTQEFAQVKPLEDVEKEVKE